MSRIGQRRLLRQFRHSSNWVASALCAIDLGIFIAGIYVVATASNVLIQALAGVLLGLSIARLFVLGHDACHQTLFTNRLINRCLGRMLFLPSLTPFSLWEVGHNLGHHVYTNLRGKDYVWTPLSKREFESLPRWRQQLERLYRSGWGHGAYYLIELWWKKLLFPSHREISNRRWSYTADSILVAAFAIAWVAGLGWAAVSAQQSIVLLVTCGFVIPFSIWNSVMGSVIYFHHTHPRIAWYDDIDRWEVSRQAGDGTIHVELPWKLGRVLHNIMDHPAHHLDVRIPWYRLDGAQRRLQAEFDLQRAAVHDLRLCVSCCKLYDYEAGRWTDFDGNVAAPVSD